MFADSKVEPRATCVHELVVRGVSQCLAEMETFTTTDSLSELDESKSGESLAASDPLSDVVDEQALGDFLMELLGIFEVRIGSLKKFLASQPLGDEMELKNDWRFQTALMEIREILYDVNFTSPRAFRLLKKDAVTWPFVQKYLDPRYFVLYDAEKDVRNL